MKKLTKLLLVCCALFICLAAVACGKQDYHTDIRMASEFTHEQGVFKTVVSSSVTQYDLLSKMEVQETATIEISKSNTFEQTVDGSNLALEFGDNIYFAKISNKNCEPQIYKFNIFRNSMLTVSFDTKGGSAVESIMVERNTLIEAPKSVKSGYTLRWNYDFTQPVTEDIIINAVWTPNDYKITIASNEADNENVVIDIKYDSEYNLADKVQAKTGYRLNGFYYVVDGHQIDFAVEGVYKTASNVTLYAKYELVEYSITYILEKGATNPNTAVKFTVNDVVELLNAEWKNDEKTFDGWYLSSDYKTEGKVTSIANLSENVTLWAKFVPTIFTTNVNCYVGNDVVYTYEFTYNSEYSLEDPTIGKGYKFDGWYLEEELLDESGVWNKKDKSIDLNAKITPINYSIVYKIPNGAINSENIITYNADMGSVELKDPNFGNHIFQGWYLDADYTISIDELNIDNVSEKVTIYSKWQYVTNVTLNSDDAECEETELVFYYGKEYALPKVDKLGYIFKGWYYGEIAIDCVGTWSYKDAEIEICAKFEARNNNIEYILPDGAQNSSENLTEYNAGMGSVELKAPSFGNHIFQGWYLDADFKTSITQLTVDNVYENMTLYSKWLYVSQVTLNLDGGSCDIESATFNFGKEYKLPTAEKLGYTFIGWFIGENEIDLTGVWAYKDEDVQLVAKYLLDENQIKYSLPEGAINGENINVYTVVLGTVQLANPTFGNHIFEGWYLDSKFENKVTELNVYNVTNGMTLYSKWQYVSNVKFDLNGSNELIEDKVFYYGQEFELPTPQIKPGCLFEGWYVGDNKLTDTVWNYKEDVVLTANWVATTIAINYELNGGVQNPENPETFAVHTGVIELKAPTNTNSDRLFYGWYTDIDFKNPITHIDTATVREITLYAKWIGTDIKVEYDANSGYVATPEQIVSHGSSYSLLTPERPGYQFNGWYYNGQLIPSVGTWTIISESVSLVAQWTKQQYNITYDLGGVELSDVYTTVVGADGTVTKVPVTLTDKYDVDSTVTIPRLFKDGYIFLGWQTNSGSVQEITIVSGSIGNRTYKASWIVDTDENGFKYAVHEDQYLICVDFMTDPGSKTKIDMPSEYGGLPVKAIATNAFSAFGLKHGPALKNKQYYYTIVLPQSITEIQTDAFINCNGICVSLRDDKGNILDFKSEDELKEWEKNVSYAPGKNVLHVRDCIWGFRPAIGWTRFSAVDIPDDYE